MTGKVISAVFCIYFLLQIDVSLSGPVDSETATTIRAIPLDNNAELESASDKITNSDGSSDTKLPPLIFPSDSSINKILPENHPTTLKFIQELNESKDKISTTPLPTSFDNGRSKTNGTTLDNDYYNEDYTEVSESEEDNKASTNKEIAEVAQNTSNGEGDELDPLNDEVEEIEDNSQVRQTGMEEQFNNDQLKSILSSDVNVPDDIETDDNDNSMTHGYISLLFGAFILMSLTLYLSLIYYRNKLEQRYGMRERLITEDDYYTNSQNDLRHFGIHN